MVALVLTAGLTNQTAAIAAPAKPGRPSIDTAFPRDGAVEVSVKLGHHNKKINRLEVASQPDGRTATLDNPPGLSTIRVEGLANGKEYTFTAVEISGGVRSNPSVASAAVTPQLARVPLAPTIAAVYGRDKALLVRWNPAPDEGEPVTGYTVVARAGKLGDPTKPLPGDVTVSATGDAGEATIPSLVNGTTYAVFVRAANRKGTGAAGVSDAKTGGTANGLVAPRTAHAPGPAVDVAASPWMGGNHRVLTVTWDAPADDGGSPITGYTVSATPGAATVNVGADARSAALIGLDPATVYTVRVTPHNAAPGGRAEESEPVTAAPGGELSGDAVVLTTDSLNSISVLQPGYIVFQNPPQQVTTLTANKIVLAATPAPNAPYGFARKVTAVQTLGTMVTVTTTEADLSEAMNARFTASATRDSMRAARITPLVPGLRASGSFGTELNISLEYEPDGKDPEVKKDPTVEAGIKASLTGTLSVDSNWSADVGIKGSGFWPWEWQITPWAEFTATTTAKASVTGEFGAYVTAQKDTKDLLQIRPGCVAVYVILLCPVITASASFTAEGSLSFTFSGKYEQTVGGRMKYDGGWSTEDLSTAPVTEFTHELSAKASVTVGLPINLSILIMDIAGPGLTFTPSLIITAEPTADPWAKLELGLALDLTFAIDILIWKERFGFEVFKTTIPLWQANGTLADLFVSGDGKATKATFDLPTGGSVNLVAHKSPCEPARPVTWTLNAGAAGTIKSTGTTTATYTAPTATGHYTEVAVAAQPATKACPASRSRAVIHTGLSTPGQPRGVKAASTATATTISWQPPADTGGSPVTRYEVIVWDDQSSPDQVSPYVLDETTGTSLKITDPDTIAELSQPDVGFTVIPFNAIGEGAESDSYHNPEK